MSETVKNKLRDGRWCAILPLKPLGRPHTIEVILINKKIILSDILIGNAFIAYGQYNMEMPLFKTENGYSEADHCENDNIRLYTVPRIHRPGIDHYGWHFSAI